MIYLTGKLDRIIPTEKQAIVSFIIPRYQADRLKDMTPDDYAIEIKPPKSRKTMQQNNYAWALMTEIARELDIFPSPEHVYAQIIKMAKISTEHIMALDNEKVLNGLKKSFRSVIKVDDRDYNGKQMAVYECCYGMSTFDKDEMIRFIDSLLNYASQVGIKVERGKYE